MTDQTTTAPAADSATTTPTPEPAPPASDVVEVARTEARAVATELLAPIVEAAAESGTEGPYAAYDETYQRFVPGTYPSAKAARDAAKAAGAGRVTVRDVSTSTQASRKR